MGNTFAIDTKTNQYCFYDKDEIVDIQDTNFTKIVTKFVYVRYIKDNSRSLIEYNYINDICTCSIPFFSLSELLESKSTYEYQKESQDGFDYKGAYLQQVNVNEELRSKIKHLEENVADGKMLINEYALELDKHEGDHSDPVDDDIRLKLLRDKNIKLEDEINKLHLEKESLMMQLSDCKMLEDRITELEEMLFDRKKEDELSDTVKDHEDRITKLEKILNDTPKKCGDSGNNSMFGYKEYDYMPYPNYVITRTDVILDKPITNKKYYV